MEELETSVTFNGEDIADLKRDVKVAQLENENIKKQMLYQEHYSQRENLLFVGIGEQNPQLSRDDDQVGSRQEVENTKEVLFNFMEQELQITNARDKFEFQRVHRLGKPKANESRPIIARFPSLQKLPWGIDHLWRQRHGFGTVFPYALDLLAPRMISNRNLRHFYSARHFVSIICLY